MFEASGSSCFCFQGLLLTFNDMTFIVFGNVLGQKIVPPVLQSFTDQDSRVRYYACEALYNIAKV
jgi:hypothetical protein